VTLEADLVAMCGTWHDILSASGIDGSPIGYDPHGGVAGPFPYENLVYVSFDRATGAYTQTNVTFRGREPHARTFEADVADGVLRFRRLGPEAPQHVGVSAGAGLIWFVSESMLDEGLQRYCEPDFIRLTGDQRTRDTALWRDGALVRTLHVAGTRLTIDESTRHALDPRGGHGQVHELRSSTTQYLGERA
jgi:hypothetical protein